MEILQNYFIFVAATTNFIQSMLELLDRPLLVLDTETTGVSPQNDRVIDLVFQIYFPANHEQVMVKRTYRFNPCTPILNSEIHGITDDDVKDCPTFSAMAKQILVEMTGCDLAGFNIVGFDIPILQAEFSRCGFNFDISNVRIIDAYRAYKKLNPSTLSNVYKQYTGFEHTEAHDALGDVNATIAIIEKMFEKGQLGNSIVDADNFCVDRDTMIDLGGVFKYYDGVAIIAIGKNKGKPVTQCSDWLNWVLGQREFTAEVKNYCKMFLRNENTTKAKTKPETTQTAPEDEQLF